MKRFVFFLVLLAALGGCAVAPFSPNPVTHVVYRSVPNFGWRRPGWVGFPVALEVYNPNPFGVLTDVYCRYTTYKWEWIGSHESHRFPIVLGDGNCRVEFYR